MGVRPGILIWSLAFAWALAATVQAQVYRCKDAAGSTSYSDRPCAGPGVQQVEIPASRSPAGESPPVGVSDGAASQPATYRRPARVEVPPLPQTDLGALTSALPKDAQGRPIVGSSGPGGASLVLEQQKEPGPVNALARCSALVTYCYAPGERELDACFFSVPRCATAQPWKESDACCPDACWDRYEAARKEGRPPLAAFDAALFREGGCVPGLRSGVD